MLGFFHEKGPYLQTKVNTTLSRGLTPHSNIKIYNLKQGNILEQEQIHSKKRKKDTTLVLNVPTGFI